MSTSMKRLIAVCFLLAVGGFFIADFALLTIRTRSLPKNFQVVRAGVLYRSGQMRPEHFDQVLREHQIRTVICLNPEPASAFEADACDRTGTRFISFRMPGTGVGRPEDFEKVLAVVRDPSQQPVLVHCYAGANRTGATVALYRMLEEGWRMEDALREMDVAGFDGSRDLVDHLKELLVSFQAKENVEAKLGREDSDESSSLR
jgi:protein tyrosine/serine phosphatase